MTEGRSGGEEFDAGGGTLAGSPFDGAGGATLGAAGRTLPGAGGTLAGPRDDAATSLDPRDETARSTKARVAEP